MKNIQSVHIIKTEERKSNSVTTISVKESKRAIDTHVERGTPQQRLWQNIV